MNNELLEVIHIANREFQDFIDQVAQDGANVVKSRAAVRQLEKVNLRLKQAAQVIAPVSKLSTGAPEAAYEVLKYRENLKNLRRVIETLQFSLLTEKARLENVQANMQAASAWATSLREIS